MSVTSNQLIENYLPVVKWGGLNTNKDVDFTGATNVKFPAGTLIGGSSVSALGVVTSASANALTAGRLGATTPAFNVDASTAVSVTGLNIKAGSTGQGVALLAIGETNTLVTLDSAGTGTLGLNTLHTNSGLVTIGNTTSLAGALVNGPLNSSRNFIDANGASLVLTAAQSGSIIGLDKADGVAVTLPAPVVGMYFDFIAITSVTSVGYIIHTNSVESVFFSGGLQMVIAASATTLGMVADGTTIESISMLGTTTGGLIGTAFRLTCVSSTVWYASGIVFGSGSIATVFLTE